LPRRGYRYVGAGVATGDPVASGKRADLISAFIAGQAVRRGAAFGNLSGDPRQEYFADGMVDDTSLPGLSRIKWLFGIARNSTFTYKAGLWM